MLAPQPNARYIAEKAGCFTVNFKRPDCELLNETAGSEFQLTDDLDWRFVYRYFICNYPSVKRGT